MKYSRVYYLLYPFFSQSLTHAGHFCFSLVVSSFSALLQFRVSCGFIFFFEGRCFSPRAWIPAVSASLQFSSVTSSSTSLVSSYVSEGGSSSPKSLFDREVEPIQIHKKSNESTLSTYFIVKPGIHSIHFFLSNC